MAAIPAQVESVQSGGASFELKGTTFTLPVLKLLEPDVTRIAEGLEQKIAQAPQFFHRAPLVIDIKALDGAFGSVDFALLIGALRSNGLVPVGLRGGTSEQNEIAATMELAILNSGVPSKAKVTASAQPEAATPTADADADAEKVPMAAATKNKNTSKDDATAVSANNTDKAAAPVLQGTRFVKRPVRSGQRIYAAGGDLIVYGAVSSGAEIFADGHVHVYGVLRGRAVAGVKGDQEARIFCQGLDAELVSVAGTYRMSEDIDDSLRHKPSQIFLDGQRLTIAAL